MKLPEALTTKVEPTNTARALTALALGTAGLIYVRRIPRPARRPAELALAAASPWIASYLTQLGRAAHQRGGGGRTGPTPPELPTG